MLRPLLLITLMLFCFYASGQSLAIHFTPSFLPTSLLTLTPGKGGVDLQLIIRPEAPMERITFSRWIPGQKRWMAIQNYLSEIKVKQIQTTERQAAALCDTSNGDNLLHAEEIYADGVGAEATYGAFAFSFGHEKAGTPEIQLFTFISATLWTYCRQQKEVMTYWQALEMYFPHPITFRRDRSGYLLYGTLFVNDENTRQLNALIDQFPANRPVVIDARYFNSMDIFYYPQFRRLLRKNKQISWIKPISGGNQPFSWGKSINGRNQLKETGVSRFINR